MSAKAKANNEKGGTVFEWGLPSEVGTGTIKLFIDSMAGMAVNKLTPLFLSSYFCLLYMFTYYEKCCEEMECDGDPDFHLDNITVEKMTTYIRDFKNMLEGAGGFHNPPHLLQAITGDPFEAVCLKLKRAGSRAKDDARTLAISRIGGEWGDILDWFQDHLHPGFLESVIFWFVAQEEPHREMPSEIHERIDIWNNNSSYDLKKPGEEHFSDFEKDLLYWMTTNTIFFRYKPECEAQLLNQGKEIIKVVK